MSRFAILTHDHPFLHWDLLLEWQDRALTWRLLVPPELRTLPAERIGDHRLIYLDYSGPLSGDRGTVLPWDRGSYTLVDAGPPIIADLHGSRLRCRATLQESVIALAPLPEQ